MNAYDTLSNRQRAYVDAVIEHAPALNIDIAKDDFSRAELRQISMTLKGKKWIPNWITHDQSRRVARGIFSIPEIQAAISVSPGHETEDDGEQDAVVGPAVEAIPTVDATAVPVAEHMEDTVELVSVS